MSPSYIKGIEAALEKFGFLTPQQGSSAETHGNPFPSKAKTIQAERLADLLQNDDTESLRPSPDNTTASRYNKPVTWSSPVNLAGVDEGQPVAGILVPSNPRS